MKKREKVSGDRSNETIRLSGGEAIVEMLDRADVGPMFGMGGFQLLPFYEAVRGKSLAHHLINDERCGAFAAEAWARVSGRPGVCDATLGPGATNLVTALVESLNAGVPQVVFVGDTHRDHAWKNMTQESRQMEILRPAAKEAIRIERIARIPELVRRAYAVATSGRPGPVVVDVPEDVAHDTFDFPRRDLWIDPATTRYPAYRSRPAASQVERAAALIAKAERPVPEQPVVGITGDGGFNMTIGELETACRAKTPFTLIVVNNAASGYVKALQHAVYGKYQSSNLVEMNYAEMANDTRCQGIRVTDPGQLGAAIRRANEVRSCPTVIDVVVTRDPAKMLPGVDNRALKVDEGDRPI